MKVFPVVVNRTVIQGGSGPALVDAFTIRFSLPDSIPGQSDGGTFAFTFPDTNNGLTDGATFRMAVPDSIPLTADNLERLALAIAETNPAPTDGATFRLTVPETNTAPTDGASLRLSQADTNAAPTDRITVQLTITDSSAAPTDGSRFTLTAAYSDGPNPTPTDVASLRVWNIGDTSAAPTDGVTYERRNGFSAYTVVQGTVVTPEKMVPYPDHPDPPAAANQSYMGYLQQGALQAQPIVDLHTPNVPAAGYVAGSAQLWVSWYTPTNVDTMWWEFVKHDGSIVEVLINPNDATHFGTSPQFWRRGDDPAGTPAQAALRSYLNTATVAQLNACKSRFRTQAGGGTQLNVLYVDAAVLITRHT